MPQGHSSLGRHKLYCEAGMASLHFNDLIIVKVCFKNLALYVRHVHTNKRLARLHNRHCTFTRTAGVRALERCQWP